MSRIKRAANNIHSDVKQTKEWQQRANSRVGRKNKVISAIAIALMVLTGALVMLGDGETMQEIPLWYFLPFAAGMCLILYNLINTGFGAGSGAHGAKGPVSNNDDSAEQ